MARHRGIGLLILAFALTALACNAFAGTPEPAVPPPPTLAAPPAAETAAPGQAAPTVTLPAGVTPVGTVPPAGTASPGAPAVTALVDVNVRTGPGVAYDTDGYLRQNETAVLLGRDPESGWWRIACPPRSQGPECWVSGRTQYTAAANAEGVPVAAAPPTPTPQPRDLGSVVVYVDSGRLVLRPLNLGQSPPTAGDPQLLGERTDVQAVALSGDGRRIAYLAGEFGANELRVINVDGSGDQMVVSSADLPLAFVQEPDDFAAQIGQFGWLSDAQTLLFNTTIVNLVGPGAGRQVDLWRVEAGDEPEQLLLPDSGGGAFAISPQDQLLVSRATSLARLNADGSGLETMVTFERINTASEYVYYPLPQWTASGNRALVVIPGREQFTSGAGGALWQIPATGPALRLGDLPGNLLFNPVRWSPDGNSLAYVQQVINDNNPAPVLIVAGTSGQDAGAYHSAEQLTLFDWSPDSARFLYAGPDFYAIGQPGQPPAVSELTTGARVGDARWMTPATYLVATTVGDGSRWTLRAGDVSGAMAPLATINAASLVLDVWVP